MIVWVDLLLHEHTTASDRGPGGEVVYWSLVEGAFPSPPAGQVAAASAGWPCARADFGTGSGHAQLHLDALGPFHFLSPLKTAIM